MFTRNFLRVIIAIWLTTFFAACTPASTLVPTLVPPTPTSVPPIPTQTPLPPPPTSTAIPPSPTSAPTPPTPTPRTLPQATIRVGDLDRTYLYYVPANLPRNAPLVFVLHATSMDAEGTRAYTEYAFELLADKNGFIVAYPNGYQNSWNECRKFFSSGAHTQNIDDVGFIRALTARFRDDYGINPSQVFAMGISGGGHMSYRLALELAGEITAVAAVAASLPPDNGSICRASGKPISVLIMNGTSDYSNPYDGAFMSVLSHQASAEYFAKLNGQTNSPKTTRLPHRDASDPTSVDQTLWNDAGKPEVVLYTINGGGHVFPLGKYSSVTYRGSNLGDRTGDLDGPAVIWEFFARQRFLK